MVDRLCLLKHYGTLSIVSYPSFHKNAFYIFIHFKLVAMTIVALAWRTRNITLFNVYNYDMEINFNWNCVQVTTPSCDLFAKKPTTTYPRLKCVVTIHGSLWLILDPPIFSTSKIHRFFMWSPKNTVLRNYEIPLLRLSKNPTVI